MHLQSALRDAARALMDGRLDDAVRRCGAILGQYPKCADALYLLGGALLEKGENDRAVSVLSRAVDLVPGNAVYVGSLGLGLLRQGATEKAIAILRKALSIDPDDQGARYNLGCALMANGNFEAAAEAFAIVAGAAPQQDLDLVNNWAMCCAQSGQIPRAEALLRQAAAQAPHDPRTTGNLVSVLLRLEEVAEADRRIDAALAAHPDAPALLGGKIAVLTAQDRLDEAEAVLAKLGAVAPNGYYTLYHRARLSEKRDRLDESEATYRERIRLFPEQCGTRRGLANLLTRQHRYAESMSVIREALRVAPDDIRSMAVLASLLTAAGRYAASLSVYDAALALAPDDDELLRGRALLAYALGRFSSGARDFFHYRAVRGDRYAQTHPAPLPESLAGRTVTVARDQGLGDELFFLRFMPELRRRGAQTRYIADDRLVPMLQRAQIADAVVGETAESGDVAAEALKIDALPFAIEIRDDGRLPPPVRIPALPERVGELRRRLAGLGPPPYLGVTWRAGTPERRDLLFKASPPAALGEALRGVAATVISVQRQPQEEDTAAFAAALDAPLHDLTALNEDLEAMLALMGLLDEYVCVSNTNVHLRAAQGRTCRVLTPHPAEYRWMAEGGESPWFPGSAIYRQRRDGDWSAALAALARDLRTPR